MTVRAFFLNDLAGTLPRCPRRRNFAVLCLVAIAFGWTGVLCLLLGTALALSEARLPAANPPRST